MFLIKWLLSLARPFGDHFPRIASIYRGVRDQLDFTEEPKVTPWGFKLAGNASMAKGDFEPMETKLVRDTLKDVDILVNVGANVGYYCCHALSMEKSVIAFEPIPRNVRFLCKNIKANGWSGAEIYPIALSNRVGVLEIYGGTTGASVIKGWANTPENYVTLVPSSTMDIVLGSRLKEKKALVLVDIEGAEKWMLEGALELLANDPKPIWILEICFTELHPQGSNSKFREIFETFWEHGYQAYSVDADMRVVVPEDLRRWLDSGYRDFGYVTYMFR